MLSSISQIIENNRAWLFWKSYASSHENKQTNKNLQRLNLYYILVFHILAAFEHHWVLWVALSIYLGYCFQSFFFFFIINQFCCPINSYYTEAERLLEVASVLKKCTSHFSSSHCLRSSQTAAWIMTKYEVLSFSNRMNAG